MPKIDSYLDWEMSFKKKRASEVSQSDARTFKQINSLGIPKNEFKDFMRQWKLKNH